MSTTENNNDNHSLFGKMIKGTLIGFITAFLFILLSALFSDIGVANPFLTNQGAMGTFGFFLGLGLEVYPELT